MVGFKLGVLLVGSLLLNLFPSLTHILHDWRLTVWKIISCNGTEAMEKREKGFIKPLVVSKFPLCIICTNLALVAKKDVLG
jgi:hypothetical protein